MSVIFSVFLLSNEISGCTEHKSTRIFFVNALLLPYKPIKIYRIDIDMDHPVQGVLWQNDIFKLAVKGTKMN